MKKIIALLAMTLMLVGLTGCLDPQDGSGGKLPAKEIGK
jgi:hypothetical protein